MTAARGVNLALQGGGAHGAFTWGALDRLLEDETIAIEAISATSAGAMNAAALKQGFLQDGRDGARAALSRFWMRVAGLDGHMSEALMSWLRAVAPSPALISRMLEANPAILAAEAFTRALSPYQFNPFDYHPMRAVVEEMLDYELVCARDGPKLFVSATNVRTGKARIFAGEDITPDAILASACLPTLFQAIEIDDPRSGRREAYWDGGYLGNPALFPLFSRTGSCDILIVHINPIEREALPRSSQEILNRINEISFNASLMRELRTIETINRLIERGAVRDGALRPTRVHSIQDDRLMNQLGIATKMTPNRALLVQLHDAGHAAMDRFLRTHGEDIGRCSSVDLQAVFDAEPLPG